MILTKTQEESTAEIVDVEVIRRPIREVFDALTVSRIIDDWGGGPARVQAKPGGRYILWDGEMNGIICEVDYPRKLVHTLREESWDPSYKDSMVTWTLRELDRGTELTLIHAGLPNRKIREAHREGWGEYFIGPLKAYLEYKKS